MIQRYDFNLGENDDCEGKYITYKDHVKIVTKLEAENERLRKALEEIINNCYSIEDCKIARKALEE